MRLIDVDDLIEIIKNIQEHMREANENPVPVDAREIWTLFIDMVEKQSTAYDVEAVVKEVQDIGTRFCTSVHCNDECECCDHGSIMKSIIDVVRQGGVKND